MIYKFRIVSDEVENFKREIEIDADSSFWISAMPFLTVWGMTKDR